MCNQIKRTENSLNLGEDIKMLLSVVAIVWKCMEIF